MVEYKLPSYSEILVKKTNAKLDNRSIMEVRGMLWGAQKDSSFSTKLLRHGMPVDLTMESAVRAQEHVILDLNKKKTAIGKAFDDFDSCSSELKKLQDELALRQKQMAMAAVQKYSALSIQTAYRGWKARKVVKLKKFYRFLMTWGIFKFRYKRRVRAGRIIRKAINKYWRRRNSRLILNLVKEVKLLKIEYTKFIKNAIHVRNGEIILMAKNVLSHSMLFGQRKAFHYFMNRLLPTELLTLRWNTKLNNLVRRYKRNRRLRLLQGPHGKLVFCAILQACGFLEQEKNQQVILPLLSKRSTFILMETAYNSNSLIARIKAMAEKKYNETSRPIEPVEIEDNITPTVSFPNVPPSNLSHHGSFRRASVDKLSAHKHSVVKSKPLAHTPPQTPDQLRKDFIFPTEFYGYYQLRSVQDAYELIEDLVLVASQNLSLLDGKCLMSAYNTAVTGGVFISGWGYIPNLVYTLPTISGQVAKYWLWPNYERIKAEVKEAPVVEVVEPEKKQKKKKRNTLGYKVGQIIRGKSFLIIVDEDYQLVPYKGVDPKTLPKSGDRSTPSPESGSRQGTANTTNSGGTSTRGNTADSGRELHPKGHSRITGNTFALINKHANDVIKRVRTAEEFKSRPNTSSPSFPTDDNVESTNIPLVVERAQKISFSDMIKSEFKAKREQRKKLEEEQIKKPSTPSRRISISSAGLPASPKSPEDEAPSKRTLRNRNLT